MRRVVETRRSHTIAATGNSNACHGTAIVIHMRWTKHIKEVPHTGPRITGVTIEKKFGLQVTSFCLLPTQGIWDERVQRITLNSKSTPTDAVRQTHAHLHADRRRVQCASGSNRRTRRTRLQIGMPESCYQQDSTFNEKESKEAKQWW